MASCRRSKLPNSLEVVLLKDNNDFELEQLLPVLAALPLCHSLGLIEKHNLGAFEALTIRSGLATSPALRLLVSRHEALPALAAERIARRLPCVVIRCDDEPLKVTAKAPRARFGQCTLLPSPQIDTAPSVQYRSCPFSSAMGLSAVYERIVSDGAHVLL